MCNNLNLKILNGSLGSDNGIGNFTCHKKNRNNLNQSVVDYCIVSECLVPCISDFCIDVFDRCMSDVHSPICLSIKNVQTIKNVQHLPEENCENILYKSVWKPESKTQYKNAFVENDIMQLSRDILSQQLSANPSKEEIGKLVTDLTSVIVNPAKKVGLCKKSGKKRPNKEKAQINPGLTRNAKSNVKFFSVQKTIYGKQKLRRKKNIVGKKWTKTVGSIKVLFQHIKKSTLGICIKILGNYTGITQKNTGIF